MTSRCLAWTSRRICSSVMYLFIWTTTIVQTIGVLGLLQCCHIYTKASRTVTYLYLLLISFTHDRVALQVAVIVIGWLLHLRCNRSNCPISGTRTFYVQGLTYFGVSGNRNLRGVTIWVVYFPVEGDSIPDSIINRYWHLESCWSRRTSTMIDRWGNLGKRTYVWDVP